MGTTQSGINSDHFQYEKAVFVSYAWGDESERTVDELEQAFAEHGIQIERDKKSLEYKGSIKKFEQRIGQGKCIILVISDKYLRSEHCMYELLEVDKNQELHERIFPIVLADARIYKAKDRLIYIKYWEEQIEQLDQSIKKVSTRAYMTGINAELDRYARIRASFDHLTDLLSDMNTLTPEIHAANGFSTLISAVEKQTIAENDKVEALPDEILDKKSEQSRSRVDELSQSLMMTFEYFLENCAIITEQLRPNCATRKFAMQYAAISTEWPDRGSEYWSDCDPETNLQLAKERVEYRNQRLQKYNDLTGKKATDPEFIDRLLEDINHLYVFVALQELSSDLDGDWDKYLEIYNKLHITRIFAWQMIENPIVKDWKVSIDSGHKTIEQVQSEWQEIDAWLEAQAKKMDNWINDHMNIIPRRDCEIYFHGF